MIDEHSIVVRPPKVIQSWVGLVRTIAYLWPYPADNASADEIAYVEKQRKKEMRRVRRILTPELRAKIKLQQQRAEYRERQKVKKEAAKREKWDRQNEEIDAKRADDVMAKVLGKRSDRASKKGVPKALAQPPDDREWASTGYTPRPWQMRIHKELTTRRFGVLVVHRRGGKTVLAINALIDAAVRSTRKDCRFAYVAPYLKQAKSVTWDYLRQYTQVIPRIKYNESELSVRFPGGSQIRLFGADNADALRGMYFDGVVLDEFADMRPQVWGNVIRPALADREGWALFIGTPKGVNAFHELYHQALELPGWFAGIYRVDETGVLSDEELELARATMSDAQYRQEFLCDWGASSDDVLISIDWVVEATQRVCKSEKHLVGLPKVIGVDVARFGDDRSAIIRRWGHVAFEPTIYQGVDNMTLASYVVHEIEEWGPDMVFIDGGRGEGVIDRVRQLGYKRIVEVQFGGSASSPKYKNKRAEMWDVMRQWLVDGGVLPNNKELKTDLCVPTYSFDPANRLVLEAKDKIRERGMPSTDIGDALACTFAFPVKPQQVHPSAHRLAKQRVRFVDNTYDVYEEGWAQS